MQLTAKEVWHHQKEWRSVFARVAQRTSGKGIVVGHPSAFSVENWVHSLSGAHAEEAYRLAESTELICIYVGQPAQVEGERTNCPDGRKPTIPELRERCSDLMDIYAFPPAYDWTLALYHDDFLPTFFLRREWLENDPEGTP